MKRPLLALPVTMLLLVGAAFSIANAGASPKHAARSTRGPRGSRGPRGYRGYPGTTGPAGPAGPPGPIPVSSQAVTTTFDALVPGGSTESFSIGAFTLTETASSGACTLPVLRNNSQTTAEYGAGPAATATPLAAGASTNAITPTVDTYNNLFSANLTDGTSEVYADIGDTTTSAGCVTTGNMLGQ